MASHAHRSPKLNPAAILLGIAVLVTVAGAAVYASRSSYLRPGDKIWVLGDSIGVGLLPRLSEQLGKLGYVVAGAPVGGTTIAYWAHKTDLVTVPYSWGATVVIVVLGTNDAAEAQQTGQIAVDAALLIGMLRRGNMRVVWLSPATVPKFYKGSLNVHAQLSLTGGATILDARTLPITKQDGVHPDPAGYVMLGEFIVDKLTR